MSKEKREQKIALKGPLKLYFLWPWILGACMLIVEGIILYKNAMLGLWCGIGVIAYLTITLILYVKSRREVTDSIRDYAREFGVAQKKLLINHATPYALLHADRKIIWVNREFAKIMGPDVPIGTNLEEMFPEITSEFMPEHEEHPVELEVQYDDREYRIEIRRVDHRGGYNELLREYVKGEFFYTICLYDETLMNEAVRQREDESLVACLVYIDNYYELLDKVEEVQQAILIALIDKKVASYFASVGGVVRKLERDKYFVIFKHKFFEELKSDKFSLLKDVKAVSPRLFVPTLSIGLGLGGDSYQKDYEYARMSIDLALGRGGDQCVIKNKDKIQYFGGQSEAKLTSTRVKARVKAEALREFIAGCSQVLIMGHKIADVDCFGSAMGIYRMARELGKHSHIVLDEDDITVTVKPLLAEVQQDSEYEQDLFVTSSEVLRHVKEGTLLVVVDTNRPSYTQCPELLDKVTNIVVIDHHRQMTESIENAVLAYLEPYASSASEMVTEIMHYIREDVNPNRTEANALYAGIIVDTHNFTTKAGERTFEAAAYLRKCGADITKIRKIFRDDTASYKAKAEVIRQAEIYRSYFAIGRMLETEIPSPTIIGSQAADDLLDIREVKASFVFTPYRNAIYVSARSIDEVNVQIIMERMGGGGHMSMAGAQLRDMTLEEAIGQLKNTINAMIKGGELE